VAASAFAATLAESMGLGDALADGARGQAKPDAKGAVRSCIVLWLNGGPSHLDTFDPKPGKSVAGSLKAIRTRANGVQLSEYFPHLADVANELAIVRSMTSKEGNHDRARYLLHTGYTPNPTVAHPALGSWLSEEIGDAASDLPAFVSLGGPSHDAGFLGAGHDPLITPKAGLRPANVELAKQVDDDRFARRRAALERVESSFASAMHDPKVDGRRAVYGRALGLMKSPHLSAFELEGETEKTKKDYGDTDFGRSCIVARRLVESGVRLVEVTLDGWDTHVDNFGRVKKLAGSLDPAFAGLVKDLRARKLLSSTLVVCMGEFGRTPRINGNDGRDHFPGAWSAALAGGGIKGGQAYGATDDEGAKVVDKPVSVANLFATIVSRFGVDPAKSMMAPSGRPISITDTGSVVRGLLA
jgi:uncharacterized protein (DUF1501 family)